MSIPVAILLNNAILFGAALLVLLVVALVLSRRTPQVLAPVLRVLRVPDREARLEALSRRISRAVTLVTTLLLVALLGGALLLSWYHVDALAWLRAWSERSVLADPGAALRTLGSLVALVAGALLVHTILRWLVDLLLEALQRSALFAQRTAQIAVLLRRIHAALRVVVIFGALLLAARMLAAPDALTYPLLALTYIVVGTSVARAVAALAHVAVDVLFDVARAIDTRKNPLRYLARLEHLASVTKRTADYFIFVGAATWIWDQLRPDTWLSETGRVAIRVIALIYIGRVIVEVVDLAIREALLSGQEERSEAERQQRMTLAPVLSSIVRYTVYFCTAVMALGEMGVDTSPLLAGAGLLGIAVGLGAQAFVGDLVSGFFILFEGLFLVGHRVRVGEVVGVVEEIGVRVLKIRDEAGVLHAIPNGEVRSVASHSRTYVNAIVEFGVPYDENIPRVLAQLAAHMKDARTKYAEISEDPELLVQEFGDSSALIRCVAKVAPGQDDRVCELLRLELLIALAAAGVAPPFSRRVVRLQTETPPLRAVRPGEGS